MGDSTSAWDWVSGINAIALSWYGALSGDPYSPYSGSGATGTIGQRGAAFTLDLGTIVTIGAVVLLMVVLLRKR